MNAPHRRLPRIGLMGEFSAGKTTLSNLLLGAEPLPERVTATSLPPVWLSHGADAPWREDLDGQRHPVAIDQLHDVAPDDTRVIRVQQVTDILELCDLIDFPGISDPNMAPDVCNRMLDEVDAVIWCTPATQAWRQSEAAMWQSLPETVRTQSILLVTRYDKLHTPRDRLRVLKRLEVETKGEFSGIFPISLTQALDAGEDYDAWQASGADAFVTHLIALIRRLAAQLDQSQPDAASRLDAPSETAATAAPTPPSPICARYRIVRPSDAAEGPSTPHAAPQMYTPQAHDTLLTTQMALDDLRQARVVGQIALEDIPVFACPKPMQRRSADAAPLLLTQAQLVPAARRTRAPGKAASPKGHVPPIVHVAPRPAAQNTDPSAPPQPTARDEAKRGSTVAPRRVHVRSHVTPRPPKKDSSLAQIMPKHRRKILRATPPPSVTSKWRTIVVHPGDRP